MTLPDRHLALKGAALSDGALQALLNLVAIALESAQSRETAGRAELMQRSEQFKATLLDALAHIFEQMVFHGFLRHADRGVAELVAMADLFEDRYSWHNELLPVVWADCRMISFFSSAGFNLASIQIIERDTSPLPEEVAVLNPVHMDGRWQVHSGNGGNYWVKVYNPDSHCIDTHHLTKFRPATVYNIFKLAGLSKQQADLAMTRMGFGMDRPEEEI